MEECKNVLDLLNKIKFNDFEDVQKLLTLHKKILLRIKKLEKKYIESCDLLKLLEKEKLLFEIQEYAKEMGVMSENFYAELLNMDNITSLEIDIITKTLHKKKLNN